jgi:glyoxylase-like metal-dependent hydrolase (beta-lactamase superfamily II)
MKKIRKAVAMIIAAFVAAGILFCWHGYRRYMAVEAVPVDPLCTLYSGGGGNSLVLVSADGSTALVVDTNMGSAAKKLRAGVKAADITIVNTHLHADHTGGNSLFTNAKIIAGAYTREQWTHFNRHSRYPDQTLKPGEETIVHIDAEAVQVRNMGQGHTWNDVVVYLPSRKLLVTGDLVFADIHPVMFAKSGCSAQSWIAALDSLLTRYDITTLVPGHGNVSDRSALSAQKEYFGACTEAVANPQKIGALKAKYAHYHHVPIISGLSRTLDFIRNERKAPQ